MKMQQDFNQIDLDRARKMARSLEGIVPPIVTPLAARDELDAAGLERLIERVIAGGVSGIFLLGTTGEGPNLSYALRRQLIELTCRQVNGRIPVLVCVTDTSLAESLALARHAADKGAQALVFSAPYYLPVGPAELEHLIRTIAAEATLPLYLYNMPQMTKVHYNLETLRGLASIESVVGIKDSSGDLNNFRLLMDLARLRPDWRFFVGPEHLLTDTLRLGGHGGVSGGSQIDPQIHVNLFNAFRRGDEAGMAASRQRLAKLREIYNIRPNASSFIYGIKCGLSLLGVCNDRLAEPFLPFTPDERARVRAVLEELNLLK